MKRFRVLGDELEIHVTGADSNGALCVVLDSPRPSFRLDAHAHLREDETIHVLHGTFEVVLDGEKRTVEEGETIHIPRGTPHATRNVGDRPGRRILVFTPAGIEDFFAAVDGESDPAALAAAAERHGWQIVS